MVVGSQGRALVRGGVKGRGKEVGGRASRWDTQLQADQACHGSRIIASHLFQPHTPAPTPTTV